MPPRKASTTAKAAPAKATATAKTETAAKRKRTADDDEPAAKVKGVNGVNGAAHDDAQPAKKARKETTKTTARAKTPAAEATPDIDTDKENAEPTAAAKKRAKAAAAAAAAAPAALAVKATKATKATAAKANTAVKRKAEPVKKVDKHADAVAKAVAKDSEDKDEKDEAKATPAPAVAAAPKKAAAKKPAGRIGVTINEVPTQVLDVFVFGEGSSGELGLGHLRTDGKKPVDVKRPRLNANLAAATVGVVQVAAGGMHAVALTKDNKILTWGVNDQGALGRDTTWNGGLRDAGDSDGSDDDDDDDDDSGLNPRESTPAEVDTSDVVPGTRFVQVVASDSASFALTADGRVYGWGTFRASDGILGFSPLVSVQRMPVLLPEPKKIKALATGSNHILALDAKGKLFTWGCPEQNQLGRRCVQRDIKASALRPGGVGFKRGVHVAKIACGSYHSFALDEGGRVYAWGLNNFGQVSVEQGAGDSDATVLDATLVEGLADYRVADVDGGEHHSVACTDDGRLFTWGRIDGHQVGLPASAFTADNAVFDEHGKPRILKAPTQVPGVPASIVQVCAGTDNTFALTRDGKAYSWGFSTNYQTGQGTTDDVEAPTLIDNTAVRDKKLVVAGAGGQFSILASAAA